MTSRCYRMAVCRLSIVLRERDIFTNDSSLFSICDHEPLVENAKLRPRSSVDGNAVARKSKAFEKSTVVRDDWKGPGSIVPQVPLFVTMLRNHKTKPSTQVRRYPPRN